jgi:VWFA-related protein
MEILKRCYLPLLIALLFMSHVMALSQSNTEEAIISRYQLTTIEVQVISRKSGQPILDLNAEDFVVKEDGEQQYVMYMEQEAEPLSILLLIDRNIKRRNSIQDQTRLKNLQSSLILSMHKADEVSVMAITDGPTLLQDFTSDKRRVGEVLTEIFRPGGAENVARETDYGMALSEAAKQMRRMKKPLNRRVIIFISAASKSEVSTCLVQDEATKALLTSMNIFYWYNLTPVNMSPSDLPKVILSRKLRLADLIGLTGGEMVGGELTAIIRRLRERYTIGYMPIRSSPAGILHRIDLKISPSAKIDNTDLEVTYRKAYINSASN